MAPAKSTYHYYPESGGGAGLSIGAIVGIVIMVLIAIFLCTFAYKVYKARKAKGPINYGEIFVESLKWAACGACICCIGLFASGGGGNSNDQNAGADVGGGNQQYESVPQMQPAPPNIWQPVQSEAQDPIQFG